MGASDAFWIAKAHFELKNDSAAARLANYSIRRGNPSGDAYLLLALAQINLQDYSSGINSLRQCLAIYPNSKKARLEKANAFYLAKQLDSAVAAYQEIQILYPKQQVGWIMVPQIYFERNQYQAANAAYREALIRLDRGETFWVEALLNIARIEKYHLHNWEGAKWAYEQLLAENPANADIESMLLQLHLFFQKSNEAENLYASMANRYVAGTLGGKPQKLGGVAFHEWTTNGFFVSGFKFFQDRPSGLRWRFYIFTEDGSRSLAKTEVSATHTFVWKYPTGEDVEIANRPVSTLMEAVKEMNNQLELGLPKPQVAEPVAENPEEDQQP